MKSVIGKVVSAKMTSTAIVEVKRFYHYPLYGKIITRKGKIHAHNTIGAKEGQQVEIISCRPYAKTVAFEISKIIGLGKSVNLSNLSNLTNESNSTNKPKKLNKSNLPKKSKTKKL